MKFKAFISKTTAKAKSGMSKVSNTVKLYSTRTKITEELTGMYDTLGKMSYAEAIGEEVSREDIIKIVDEITRLKQELAAAEESIRAVNEKKLCPQCNMELQSKVAYCPYCGVKITEEETTENNEDDTQPKQDENS